MGLLQDLKDRAQKAGDILTQPVNVDEDDYSELPKDTMAGEGLKRVFQAAAALQPEAKPMGYLSNGMPIPGIDPTGLGGGVMGTINDVTRGAQAVDEGMSLAQRIKQAAQNSGVKVIPTAEQAAAEQMYGGAPKNFFQKYGREGQGVGPASSADEQAARQFQQKLRDDAIAERNANQIEDTNKQRFQQLMNAMGRNKD